MWLLVGHRTCDSQVAGLIPAGWAAPRTWAWSRSRLGHRESRVPGVRLPQKLSYSFALLAPSLISLTQGVWGIEVPIEIQGRSISKGKKHQYSTAHTHQPGKTCVCVCVWQRRHSRMRCSWLVVKSRTGTTRWASLQTWRVSLLSALRTRSDPRCWLSLHRHHEYSWCLCFTFTASSLSHYVTFGFWAQYNTVVRILTCVSLLWQTTLNSGQGRNCGEAWRAPGNLTPPPEAPINNSVSVTKFQDVMQWKIR